jgi:hypothetical protein
MILRLSFFKLSTMLRKITVEIITLLFIILWVYAGLSKLIDYSSFRFQLGRSPYIELFASIIAIGLPMIEILIAFALLFSSTRLIGLYASFFLMALFTGYIYMMLHYSYFISCSCGGILSKMDWDTHLTFNLACILLIGLGILLFETYQTEKKLNSNSALISIHPLNKLTS